MRHASSHITALVLLLAVACGSVGRAQVPVQYNCKRPTSGSSCVQYRWYICWPDSNTVTLAATTTDTFATVTHVNSGERVRVQGVDALGRAGTRSVASAPWTGRSPTGVPEIPAVRLDPNYPNPFNPSTTIPFELTVQGHVRLEIFRMTGELVRTLVDAELPAGRQSVIWDGRDADGRRVASGSYLCRLEAEGRRLSLRLALVK